MEFKTDKSQFAEETTPEIGQHVRTQGEGGHPLFLTVKDIAENEITVDANHSLAGKDLNFTLELVEIL